MTSTIPDLEKFAHELGNHRFTAILASARDLDKLAYP
jgi:hypothetical protein